MAIDGISSTSSRTRYFGLASGLDVDEIVRGLLQVERAPIDRLVQRKQILEWQQEDLRAINRMLRELDDLAFQLRLESTFSTWRLSVSDPNGVTVRAIQGVADGTHTVVVEQLATGVKFHSAAEIQDGKTFKDQFGLTDPVSFTITRIVPDSGDLVTHTFTFDPSTTTIRDVVAQINNAGLGLKATFEPGLGRFFLESDATGSDVQYKIEDTDGFLESIIKLTSGDGEVVSGSRVFSGQNSRFKYNGVTIERSTNEFVAGGMIFTLQVADANKTITVSVSRDVDATVNAIKSFVDKYNEIVSHINGKLAEKRYFDYPPLTDAQRKEMKEDEIKLWEEKAKSGLLRGDAMLAGITAALREALSSVVSETGSTYNTLSSIGISTGNWEERGYLHLDEAKLRQALEQDSPGVAALFRQSGSDSSKGLAQRVRDVLSSAMERITNRVGRVGHALDTSVIGRQIGWIDEAIERAEARLAQREAYYYRQFSVLETFMNQANTQSLWLSQVFMSWWA